MPTLPTFFFFLTLIKKNKENRYKNVFFIVINKAYANVSHMNEKVRISPRLETKNDKNGMVR